MGLAWERRRRGRASLEQRKLPLTLRRLKGWSESIQIHIMTGAAGAFPVVSSWNCSCFYALDNSYGIMQRGEGRREIRHEMCSLASNSRAATALHTKCP